MKKLILSITLAAVVIITSADKTYAQKGQTHFGIKAGLSLTTLGAFEYGTLYYDYNFRPGFQAGVFIETPVSKSLTFSPQVLFTQKGGNVNTNSRRGVPIKGSTPLSYIDVPLLIGFKAIPNLTFYAGPQVSFSVSESYTLDIGNSTVSSTDDAGAKKANFGGNVGAGYKFSNNLGLNVNYIFDVTRTFKESYDGGEKIRGFAFTLGYTF